MARTDAEMPIMVQNGLGKAAISSFYAAMGLLAIASSAQAQASGQAVSVTPSAQSGAVASMPALTIEQLVCMTPQQLDALYQQGTVAAIPDGKVRGTALFKPGTRMAVPMSKAARLMWQGKVIHNCDATAVNRFFGMRIIRGNLYQGESWLDGRPSLILDYCGTSLLYGNNRDEIRQVGPGLYLGLMYARTTPQPTFKMYFALEASPCSP